MARHLFHTFLLTLCIMLPGGLASSSPGSTKETSSSDTSSPNGASNLKDSMKESSPVTKDYCVIGAGPGGLQMGYFLQRSNRDYVIFERSNTSGAFFVKYPRHRTLISINKIYTGKTNKEFNLRHDWNSLISDDESLLMKHYSEEFFPPADDYVRYLQDYAKKFDLNIQYNTNISNIQRVANKKDTTKTDYFTMRDQTGNGYTCRYLIVCTGIDKPNKPRFLGEEHTESYEDMSLDLNDYKGQSVVILGRGNSAFETADHLMGVTNLIHVYGRDRVRLSWETHYVGDLRAINNGLLDTYMLKSLNGLIETGDVSDLMVVKRSDGKLFIPLPDIQDITDLKRAVLLGDMESFNFSHRFDYDEDHLDVNDFSPKLFDNFAAREPYDRVIRCLGFKFDFDLFESQLENNLHTPFGVRSGAVPKGIKPKYPFIKNNYEAVNVPGLFFAGTNTHSLDQKKSAGGFIHGFRYTARALHKILEWRNHGVPWPSVKQPITGLLDHVIKRINEASGIYQMFGVLADVVILTRNDTEYEYLEEFPLRLLDQLQDITRHEASRVLVISLEYGRNFSGPGKDVFREGRATGMGRRADRANFLHPIIYFYSQLPTSDEMANVHWIAGNEAPEVLPEPTDIHYMVEDFLTEFNAPITHILLLRRFLENILNQDLRSFFDTECFEMTLSHTQPPETCKEFYLQGQGLPFYEEINDARRENRRKMMRRKRMSRGKQLGSFVRGPKGPDPAKKKGLGPFPSVRQ